MVAEGQPRFLEPGERFRRRLEQDAIRSANPKATDDLLDQLAFAFGRKSRDDLLIIENTCRDQRLVPAGAVGMGRAHRFGRPETALTSPR